MSSSLPALPSDFLFGAATSAFQIEGAATSDGKGPSIWDVFCRVPGAVAGGDTGDIACDHLARMDEDLEIMSALGLGAYRFSVSWPRVMPDGHRLERRGLDAYERLVDGLLERGMEPWLTLYHWDLPHALQEEGGWAARHTVDRFQEYAAHVIDRLGDRVTRWTTFNEPWVAAFLGHAAGVHAPGHRNVPEALAAAHHMLLAHGRVVGDLRRARPDVQAGITLNMSQFDPLRPEDEPATRLIDGQMNRFFLDPLFRASYPADVVEALGDAWPQDLVRPGDLEAISTPIDFLGVNYYRGEVVSTLPSDEVLPRPDTTRPAATPYPASEGVHFHTVVTERTAMGWAVQPEGLTRVLRRVSEEYSADAGVVLYVTENGAAMPDLDIADGAVHDADRARFVEAHLHAVADARAAGVDVRGYFYWSLLDNFEWDWGYGPRFGIVRVEEGTLARTVKDSGHHFARLIAGVRAGG